MALAPLEFTITAGPSKFDLMTSLFISTAETPHYVMFTLRLGLVHGGVQQTQVCINSVEREDGGDERWRIKGWVVHSNDKFNGSKIEGTYDTKERQGRLTYTLK